MGIRSSDREVLDACINWLDSGYSVELVTVAKTWGSSPRPPGSLAAVRSDGVLAGSVSGGCVEKQLAESFKGDKDSRTISRTIDDLDARRYGLACGGNIELVFETVESATDLRQIVQSLDNRERVRRTISLIDHSITVGPAQRSESFQYDGQSLTNIFGPHWRVLIIGAGQLSRYTAEFAKALDFEVIVCEPRPEFQTAWSVAQTTLVTDLPDDAVRGYGLDAGTAVLALTHDPNLDDLALIEALPSESFYVGALGSKRNYQNRKLRLRAIGVDEADIERLHGPIGLPIDSRTSPEIAISIMAQLIQCRSSLTSGLQNPI